MLIQINGLGTVDARAVRVSPKPAIAAVGVAAAAGMVAAKPRAAQTRLWIRSLTLGISPSPTKVAAIADIFANPELSCKSVLRPPIQSNGAPLDVSEFVRL